MNEADCRASTVWNREFLNKLSQRLLPTISNTDSGFSILVIEDDQRQNNGQHKNNHD
jgi:hypothetical protein